MRRVLHEGHTPRPLQEKATRKSCPQSSQRARAKQGRHIQHIGRLKQDRIHKRLACNGKNHIKTDKASFVALGNNSELTLVSQRLPSDLT